MTNESEQRNRTESRHVTRRGGGNAYGRRTVAAATGHAQDCCCAADRTCLLHFNALADADRETLTGRRSTARRRPTPDADRRRWRDVPAPRPTPADEEAR